jgi:two-component system, OmpR family, response regulator CpxR
MLGSVTKSTTSTLRGKPELTYTAESFPMASTPKPHAPLILCIDDDEVALRVRKLLLSSAGYQVLSASSAETGFEILQENAVDLVIADHFLSDKTGTEIAREMKGVKPQVPILIVSAASEALSGLEFADGFLPKGEAPDALLTTVARLLPK